jgi:hypothetical protein
LPTESQRYDSSYVRTILVLRIKKISGILRNATRIP